MAAISAFDILKIGVGPSSSHTLGPWRAAQRAVERWQGLGVFDRILAVRVDLYGSLAKTGHGHMTDMAVLLGLSNEDPVRRDTAAIPGKVEAIRRSRTLPLGGRRQIGFDPATDLRFHRNASLPQHPNGLTFTAILADGTGSSLTYFSVGGGFIVEEDDEGRAAGPAAEEKASPSPAAEAKTDSEPQGAARASGSPDKMPAKYGCTACHAVDRKVVGPAFKEVAAKYRGQDVEAKLSEKVRNGGGGVWGQVPMTPNPQVPDEDLHAVVEWILSLK